VSRYLGDDWLLPLLDANTRAYFTAGELMLQACSACGRAQHPPEDLCRTCGSHDVGPRRSEGRGRIESVAIVHHAVHPRLKERVPYAVVLVSIDDAPGVNLIGNVLGAKIEELSIGARVRTTFEEALDPESGERLLIPQWELDRSANRA
jgi:uncharacterized OB-fold protein